MTQPYLKLKSVLFAAVLVCAGGALVLTLTSVPGKYTYDLKAFSSYDDLRDFLQQRSSSSGGYPLVAFNKNGEAAGARDDGAAAPDSQSTDYSTTNVQVEGVDEPDIVKTDGTYLYLVANNKVYVILAYPPGDAQILSTISYPENSSVQSIFINGDSLIVFSTSYDYPIIYRDGMKSDDGALPEGDNASGEGTAPDEGVLPEEGLIEPAPGMWWGGTSESIIRIYDMTDRANLRPVKEIKLEGTFSDARMIGDTVYVVAYTPTYVLYAAEGGSEDLKVPCVTIDNVTEPIPADDIYYVDVPELADSMTHVLSVNVDTLEVNERSFMLGSSQVMYVSSHNIFLATIHYPFYGLMRDGSVSSDSYKQTTVIHKIAIADGAIDYVAQGEVEGRILNQFSMDEHEGFFRIATTIDAVWNSDIPSSNNIFVLDANLEQVSELTDIAPGESIYACRFLGDRAFLVTFVQVDPLFTIDMADPYNPRILGELKIPGYSEYLHPFDENHIIGIGKEVDPTIDEDKVHSPYAVYYTAILGLKLALFDVTDIENPVEEAKIVIGDRGTDSPALYEHKAFLFDREKELLVIPVSLFEIPQQAKDQYNQSSGTSDLWGEYTFQGAYVYHLSLEDGFSLQGRITHQSQEQMDQTGELWYWGMGNTDITRALFIDDTLYTISGSKVKMNSLTALTEETSISLT